MRTLIGHGAAGALLCLAAMGSARAEAPSGTVLIVNRASGLCAEVKDATGSGGASIEQRRCIDTKRQRWRIRETSGGHQLVNVGSDLCLSSASSGGLSVNQAKCDSARGRVWKLRASGHWFKLSSAATEDCLDVANGSADEAAQVVRNACGDAKSQKWTLSAAGPRSGWSNVIDLPLVPASAATLRNGKILMWSAHDRFSFGEDQGKTFTSIFDPNTETSTSVVVSNTNHDMFCPGTATLPDGRILVSGGTSAAKTSIYDPATNTWTAAAEMNVPRGYQGNTPMPDGSVFTAGGSWSGGIGYKASEMWTPGGGWRVLEGINGENLSGPDPAGPFRADNHMWLFAWSNRHVFHAGPSAEMHWLDVKGSGSIGPAIARGDDEYAMNGNVVLVGRSKLLKVGGAPAYESLPASASAYTVNFSGGPAGPVKVVKQRPMAFARAFANSVALPGGDVVVVGGQNFPVAFSDDGSVMIPEIWSPSDGQGSFRRLEPMVTPRNYHSIALLMKDARVFVAGGGLCGPCDTNHPNAEILTPPYLLNEDGSPAQRPVILAAPSRANPGDVITVTTTGPISKFSFNRIAAVTHSVANDQRSIQVAPKSNIGFAYRVALPKYKGGLLPGDWMLFAINNSGVPSVAAIIRIERAS